MPNRVRNKLVITLQIDRIPTLGVDRGELKEAVDYRDDPRMELTNCTYLEDSATSVLGLNVYGTPWQPEYCGWAFNLPRGTECLKKWNEVRLSLVRVESGNYPPRLRKCSCYLSCRFRWARTSWSPTHLRRDTATVVQLECGQVASNSSTLCRKGLSPSITSMGTSMKVLKLSQKVE